MGTRRQSYLLAPEAHSRMGGIGVGYGNALRGRLDRPILYAIMLDSHLVQAGRSTIDCLISVLARNVDG